MTDLRAALAAAYKGTDDMLRAREAEAQMIARKQEAWENYTALVASVKKSEPQDRLQAYKALAASEDAAISAESAPNTVPTELMTLLETLDAKDRVEGLIAFHESPAFQYVKENRAVAVALPLEWVLNTVLTREQSTAEELSPVWKSCDGLLRQLFGQGAQQPHIETGEGAMLRTLARNLGETEVKRYGGLKVPGALVVA